MGALSDDGREPSGNRGVVRRRPTLWHWLSHRCFSGNLEALDFDCPATYRAFVDLAIAAGLGELVERIEAGSLEETPGGGRHWFYRCDEIAGNTKLARRLKRREEMRDEHDTIAPLIETRGQGGYIVAAPSNGRVHPSGRPYRWLRGGVATIAPSHRRNALSCTRWRDRLTPCQSRLRVSRAPDRPAKPSRARITTLVAMSWRSWKITAGTSSTHAVMGWSVCDARAKTGARARRSASAERATSMCSARQPSSRQSAPIRRSPSTPFLSTKATSRPQPKRLPLGATGSRLRRL